jgi:DNA-directed RNA polymerase subunit beta'
MANGVMGTVVIEHKEDLHPQIVIVGEKRRSCQLFDSPAPTSRSRRPEGACGHASEDTSQDRQDQGHHRWLSAGAERSPPSEGCAEIAKIDGVVDIGGTVAASAA